MFILSLVFALSVAGSPAATELVPAGDEALSFDLVLDGYKNGYMTRERLMTFNGCTLERDAAYTYALLMEAAANDRVFLAPIDCYRTFNEQKGAYNRRCPYVDTAVYERDPITGDQYEVGTKSVRNCTGPPTARPGYSNHGWGRAVDFSGGSSTLGCRDRGFIWLQSNASRFGWVHPPWAHCGRVTAEPWHWEYASLIDVDLLPTVGISLDLEGVLE
ncbi:MAG: M15 family metallopeptidase [Acidimicrobiia bacterium]